MRQVEITASSLEEATRLAAAELEADPDAIELEVLEAPRRILGFIGSGEYRVRAWVKAAGDEEVPPLEELVEGELEEQLPKPPELAKPVAERDVEVVAERALKLCQDIIDLFELEARAVLTSIGANEVNIELQGEGLGLLIGRHGATLDAMQLLVAIIANRGVAEGGRVILDAENYRERRQEMLERMAHSHAEKAKRTGKEVVIPELKPYERRIIHMTLADDPGVETYSEGHGAMRQLVISPRDTG